MIHSQFENRWCLRGTVEKVMAPHSSTLGWKIPWTEEPGRLQSMGSLRVRHDWETSLSLFTFMHWRRKWQPTPVFLPGESQGWGSLVGCRLWGRRVGDDSSDLAAAAAAAQEGQSSFSVEKIWKVALWFRSRELLFFFFFAGGRTYFWLACNTLKCFSSLLSHPLKGRPPLLIFGFWAQIR